MPNPLDAFLDPVLDVPWGELGAVRRAARLDGRWHVDAIVGYPVEGLVEPYTRLLEQQLNDAVVLDLTFTPPQGRGAPGVSHIIAVASGKGGVGKSTTAVNLALAMDRAGAKTGILDADIYGPSQGMMLGVPDGKRPEIRDQRQFVPLRVHGIEAISMSMLTDERTPMVWRGPMASGALQQLIGQTAWGDLDYLIVDMPPGTGDIQLTLSQQASVSGAVIVTTPQDIALLDARKGIEMFRKVDIPILGIVENMSWFECDGCGQRHRLFGSGGGARRRGRVWHSGSWRVPARSCDSRVDRRWASHGCRRPGGAGRCTLRRLRAPRRGGALAERRQRARRPDDSDGRPMTIKSDRWIREMAAGGMIEPFESDQVRRVGDRPVISYGTSSYGYDVRCAPEFKVFTNIFSATVDPKAFDARSFVDVAGESCIIPPNAFALARTVEYFRIPRDVLTLCVGKSTYARCGIIVNVTPLEPEWEGTSPWSFPTRPTFPRRSTPTRVSRSFCSCKATRSARPPTATVAASTKDSRAYSCPGPDHSLERLLALAHHAVKHARLLAMVGDRRVQRAPVVPHGEVAHLPTVAVHRVVLE